MEKGIAKNNLWRVIDLAALDAIAMCALGSAGSSGPGSIAR
jgi:hypothetical protein